jgi:hypothetical protein
VYSNYGTRRLFYTGMKAVHIEIPTSYLLNMPLHNESLIKYHDNLQPIVAESAFVKHVTVAAVSVNT